MKVTATRVIETCLDGTMNVEKTVDRAMDRKFIYHLAILGDFEYFPQFSRPFFRITRSGSFILKGVEGADTFQVFIIRNPPDVEREIENTVRRFPS